MSVPTVVTDRTIALLKQPPPPLMNLVVNAHSQQHALQAPGNHIQPPNAPAFAPQSRRQTPCPYKTAGRLDAHHRDAQAADSLEAEGRVELGEVLDAGEDGGDDSQGVGPGLEVLGIEGGDYEAGGESRDEVDDAGDCDEQSGPVGGPCRGVFGRRQGRGAWVEDEEEEQTKPGLWSELRRQSRAWRLEDSGPT